MFQQFVKINRNRNKFHARAAKRQIAVHCIRSHCSCTGKLTQKQRLPWSQVVSWRAYASRRTPLGCGPWLPGKRDCTRKTSKAAFKKHAKRERLQKCAKRKLLQNADGSQPAQAPSWLTPVWVLKLSSTQGKKRWTRSLRQLSQRTRKQL